VHHRRGEIPQAEACELDAITHLPEGGKEWMRAIGELLVLSGRVGRFDRMSAWIEHLAAREPETPDAALSIAIALVTAGDQLILASRLEPADRLLAHVAERLAPIAGDHPILAARLDRVRGLRALLTGEYGASAAAFEASIGAFEAAGDLRTAAGQRCNLAEALIDLGDYEGAERALQQGLAVADRVGLRIMAAMGRTNLGRIQLARGAIGEARATLERSVAAFVAMGDLRLEGEARRCLSECLAVEGDVEGALAMSERALARLASFPVARKESMGSHAGLLARAGRFAEAIAAAREVVAHVESQGGITIGESQARLVVAEALDALGDREGARAAIRAAREALLARAARIHDARLRGSFLERVEENARTLALARAWLGEAG
jgi:tetratricopeptide (TPR) repeat protein